MKVLQLISSGGFYGAEAMMLYLSRALRQNGHSIKIVAFINRRNPHDEIARRARELDFEVVELPCGGKLDMDTLRRLRTCIEESASEIIHSHGYKSNLYALAANYFTKRALVSTCHNWTRQTASLRAYSILDRFCLHFFDRVFCVSEEVRLSLLKSGIPKRKLKLIFNGIPVSDFFPIRSSPADTEHFNEPVIGMVGRLVEAKGFRLVLQCAPAILKRFPKARFVLIGEGPERENWIRLAKDLGIGARVMFPGNQKDMRPTYNSLSIFVLPSLNEGMPMTILEAMAAGVPVIATKVGSIPQMIRHEETGLLVEKGDIVGLQKALERLLGDPEFGMNLGRRGQEFVSANASIERTADNYIHGYEELLPSSRHNELAIRA